MNNYVSWSLWCFVVKERKRSSIERRKKGRRKLLEKNVRFWNYKFIISITMDKLYATIYLYIYQHMFFLSYFSSFLFFCLFHFIQTFLGDIQARWKSRAALFIHSNNKPVGPNILVSHLQPSAEYFIHKLQSKLECEV